MRGERAHQLLPGRVDLALVVAHLLRGVQQRQRPAAPSPPGRVAHGGRPPARSVRLGVGSPARARARLGVERDVDVESRRRGGSVGRPASRCGGVGGPAWRPRPSSASAPSVLTSGPPRHSDTAVRPHRLPRRAGHGRPRPARRRWRRGRRPRGRPRGGRRAPPVPRPGVQRAAHQRSQVPAGARAARATRDVRGGLAQLGQAAHGEQPEYDPTARRTGSAPGPGSRILAAPLARAGAPRRRRRRRAGGGRGPSRRPGRAPNRHRGRPGRAGSPEGQGQQDAERDQADRPQVAGLHAPERLRAAAGSGAASAAGRLGLLLRRP